MPSENRSGGWFSTLRNQWLWLILALILLFWVLRDISWQTTWAAIRQLALSQIILLVLANALVLLPLYARWQLILKVLGYGLPLRAIARYSLAGFAVSYLTPGPQFGGEPFLVYLLNRKEKIPATTAAASVALDKALTLLTNFSFLCLGLLIVLQGRFFDQKWGAQALVIAGLFLALPLGLLLAWGRGGTPIAHLARRAGLGHRRGVQAVEATEAQVTYFCRRHPVALWLGVGLSVANWIAIIGEYWLMAYFLGLRPTVWQGVALLTAVRIAFLMPFPGALGTLEAAQILALEAMGLPSAVGLSLSLLIHARDLSLALLGLWWSGAAAWLLNRSQSTLPDIPQERR